MTACSLLGCICSAEVRGLRGAAACSPLWQRTPPCGGCCWRLGHQRALFWNLLLFWAWDSVHPQEYRAGTCWFWLRKNGPLFGDGACTAHTHSAQDSLPRLCSGITGGGRNRTEISCTRGQHFASSTVSPALGNRTKQFEECLERKPGRRVCVLPGVWGCDYVHGTRVLPHPSRRSVFRVTHSFWLLGARQKTSSCLV